MSGPDVDCHLARNAALGHVELVDVEERTLGKILDAIAQSRHRCPAHWRVVNGGEPFFQVTARALTDMRSRRTAGPSGEY